MFTTFNWDTLKSQGLHRCLGGGHTFPFGVFVSGFGALFVTSIDNE